MNPVQQLIDFTKITLTNISKIDDTIDKILVPFKDYADTIQDISTPIKSLISIIDLKRKLSLKAFLLNYSMQLSENYKINEAETIKLQTFFKNKKNILYISDIIDTAMQSNSLKATSLLGVIAAKFIKKKSSFDYIDISIIESLKVMNDFDIENFVELYEYILKYYTFVEKPKEFRTKDFYNIENINKININRESLEITIEKLKRTNGLTYGIGGIGNVGNAKGAFELNNTSERLYSLFIDTKIQNNSYD